MDFRLSEAFRGVLMGFNERFRESQGFLGSYLEVPILGHFKGPQGNTADFKGAPEDLSISRVI